MWNDLEEFILKLAIENSEKTGKKTKIVEIGAGKFQTISKNLSENENIELIIKPLFNEDLNMKTKKMKLKNYNRASFYIYER